MPNPRPIRPMGHFHEAKKVVITGGEFSNVQTNNLVYGVNGQSDIVSLLHGHSATAGLLNARERFDAPKCDEDTRISVIRGMKEWVQDGDESSGSSMYWLHGPAGVGKSALAQSLALKLERDGDHAASFFFSRTAPGRSNGGQLIATLACQLAVHIPQIRPFLAKSIKDNPFVFESSNMVQVDKLIIHPVNAMQRKYQRSHRLASVFRFIRKLGPGIRSRGSKALKIPRLILVDGLDECEDPIVQCDLIMCLGRAVRDLGLPFRIVIASRPESHILGTFRLNQLFNSSGGIIVLEQDLGEDPDANQSITIFLWKEFSQIRRTHPLRNYLPEVWPMQADVDHLVRKSSKSFIYAATVIRYIKLPNNRPEECLERILGMAEIPSFDKPYEILDNLYRHIFESVPDINKKSINEIFHILIVGTGLQTHPRLGSCTTPAMIERILSYKPGHVEHVLGDLLCVVNISTAFHPIVILHASLSDFFLDAVRARHLYINPDEAHTMIAQGFHRLYVESQGRFVHGFSRFLMHIKLANRSNDLLYSLRSVDLVQCHRWAFSWFCTFEGTHSDFIKSTLSVASFVLVLSHKRYPFEDISKHITDLQDYLVSTFPAVDAVFRLMSDIEPYITPLLQAFHQSHWFLASLLKEFDYDNISQEVARAHILVLIPIFLPSEPEHTTVYREGIHAQLCILWIQCLFNIDPGSEDSIITPLCFGLISASLAKANYDPILMQFIEEIGVHVGASKISPDNLRKLEAMVLSYLRRMKADPLAAIESQAKKIEATEVVWRGLAGSWTYSRR